MIQSSKVKVGLSLWENQEPRVAGGEGKGDRAGRTQRGFSEGKESSLFVFTEEMQSQCHQEKE